MTHLYRYIFLILFIFHPHIVFSSISESTLEVGCSYRQDQLDWHVNGLIETSLDVGETEWKNVNIWQIVAKGKCRTTEHVYGCFDVDFGWVTEGKSESVFYLPNEKFWSSDNFSGKGKVYDVSAGVGYEFEYFKKTLSIIPMLGYAYHSQHFPLYDYSLLYNIFGLTFVKEDLESPVFQKNRWYGPWCGIEFHYRINDFLTLYGSYKHLWGYYRSHLGDFSQTANCYSNEFDVGYNYEFRPSWLISVSCSCQFWRTRIGNLEAYLDPGVFDIDISEIHHPLKRVRWYTAAGFCSFLYKF
jgi:hypothetical protein